MGENSPFFIRMVFGYNDYNTFRAAQFYQAKMVVLGLSTAYLYYESDKPLFIMMSYCRLNSLNYNPKLFVAVYPHLHLNVEENILL